jgi:hypothetical protein
MIMKYVASKNNWTSCEEGDAAVIQPTVEETVQKVTLIHYWTRSAVYNSRFKVSTKTKVPISNNFPDALPI